MDTAYLKIPCELAIFALQEQKYKQAGTYTATQFLYSGNAHSSDKPVHAVADATGYPTKSVYRYFKWLIDRNWFGKNRYGRYYFRGIDRVHEMEGWQFGRAAIMQEKDLKNIKAFMAGAVFTSLAKTREGQRREQSIPRSTHRSSPSVAPISLSLLADTLEVSTKTAYRLRKLADKCNYIENRPNLVEITNYTPDDLTELKKQDRRKLSLKLFGSPNKKSFLIKKIRYKDNRLFLQQPNLVKPFIHLKSRRGLSKYQPPKGINNVGLK